MPTARELSLDDTFAMRQLSERYFYAVDHSDGSAMAECFSSKCFYRVNVNPPMEMNGRQEIDEAFTRPRDQRLFVASNHTMSHHTVAVDDGRVTGTTYAVAHLVMPSEPPHPILIRGLRYDDQYVLEDGKWYIGRRIHNPLWQYQAISTEVGLS